MCVQVRVSFAKGVSEQSVNKMCVVQDDRVCTLATFSRWSIRTVLLKKS